MGNIIIAFRSRTISMRFADQLTRNGLPASIINTPRELSVGCGLSVSTSEAYLNQVKYLLSGFNDQQSLLGIYVTSKTNYRNSYIRL